MATTDDLVISIRADIGALQSQLRGIDAQLRGTERQGNETANAVKKTWRCSLLAWVLQSRE